jgi:hypothetical protein
MLSRNRRPTIGLLVVEITVPKDWSVEAVENVKARVLQNLKELEDSAMKMAWPKGAQVEPVHGVFRKRA